MYLCIFIYLYLFIWTDIIWIFFTISLFALFYFLVFLKGRRAALKFYFLLLIILLIFYIYLFFLGIGELLHSNVSHRRHIISVSIILFYTVFILLLTFPVSSDGGISFESASWLVSFFQSRLEFDQAGNGEGMERKDRRDGSI